MSIQATTHPLTPEAGTVTHPTSKASEDKMAARQGCLWPGQGAGARRRGGVSPGLAPSGEGIPAEGRGPGRGAGGSGDCSGPREAAMQTCPPTRSGPASNPPHHAAEHRERPLLGVGGKRKKDGEGLGHQGEMMKDWGGGRLSQGQREMTHSAALPSLFLVKDERN